MLYLWGYPCHVIDMLFLRKWPGKPPWAVSRGMKPEMWDVPKHHVHRGEEFGRSPVHWSSKASRYFKGRKTCGERQTSLIIHIDILYIQKFLTSSYFFWVPSLKLTARTWKWMDGIRSFPFRARPIFRGYLSFRECIYWWWILIFIASFCVFCCKCSKLSLNSTQAWRESFVYALPSRWPTHPGN